MTTVGIIGSGMIGGTVARLSVAAGHHVVVSNSRGPETLAELAAGLGPLATAGTYGPFSDEAGTPAPAARIRADLVGAHR
jgi:predicted dinucleotide-binding enzyme